MSSRSCWTRRWGWPCAKRRACGARCAAASSLWHFVQVHTIKELLASETNHMPRTSFLDVPGELRSELRLDTHWMQFRHLQHVIANKQHFSLFLDSLPFFVFSNPTPTTFLLITSGRTFSLSKA